MGGNITICSVESEKDAADICMRGAILRASIGLCEDMVEYEWATKEVIKDLVTAVKAGELTIPGFTNIEKEMPQDLLEQPAPPPKMNMLVMGQ